MNILLLIKGLLYQFNHLSLSGYLGVAFIIGQYHTLPGKRPDLILWHIYLPEALVKTNGFQKFDDFIIRPVSCFCIPLWA